MKTNRIAYVRSLLLALALLLPAVGGAGAAEREVPSPGFVDGSDFAELAGEEGGVVEITLRGPLLRSIAAVDTEDEGFGQFVRNLQSISAYVVNLDGDEARIARAARLIRDVEERLGRSGWERIARVREKTSNVNVFIRGAEPTIDGLVVLVMDHEDGEVVFANIAGRIDLARLGELGRTLNVPGLDAVGLEEKADDGKGGSKGPAKKSGAKPRPDPEP